MKHGKVIVGHHPTAEPDVKVIVGAETWDQLSRKEIGGFQAVVRGKMKFHGKLSKLKEFNSEVVEKC